MGRKKESARGTREALRQLRIGNDFEPPERMLADLTPEQAGAVPEGCPYSIAEQVAHSLFWQKRWLGIIDDEPLEPKKGKHGDWPKVAPEAWDTVRTAFLDGLKRAATKAEDETELQRPLKNGNTVEALLLMLALHNTYHLGQIALLRQMLNLWPPTGGTDAW